MKIPITYIESPHNMIRQHHAKRMVAKIGALIFVSLVAISLIRLASDDDQWLCVVAVTLYGLWGFRFLCTRHK